MHTVERRVYDTDDEGRRYLLYRPGDVISDDDAKRVASLVEPAVETPAKPLTRMNLDELCKVCEDEEIDPGDANTRAEYRKKIEAGREQRRSTPTTKGNQP